MNEVFLIYLWDIWDGFGDLTVGVILLLMFALIIALFLYYEEEIGSMKYIKRIGVALFTLVLLYALTPSKHIAVMMYSAPTIVQVAKDMKDSNTTKSISNIFDNSLKYLEKKSKELAKE